MITPPNFSDNNPNNTNMNNDVQQWVEDNDQMQADKATLNAALASMGKDLTSGNTDGALMLLFTAVLPGVLGYQQDSMSMLGENITSDLRNFNNNIQSDFNAGGNITSAQAQDLVNNVNDLKTWTTFLSTAQSGGWSSANAPLSASDASEIQENANDIQNQLTNNGKLGWNSKTVQTDMNDWFAAPVAALPSGSTTPTDPTQPNPAIKAVQGDNQQINSAVSSQATTLNTQIQFFTSQYNQFVNVDSSLQKSQISQDNSFINNQKTQ